MDDPYRDKTLGTVADPAKRIVLPRARPRFNTALVIAVLVASLLVGGVLVGVGISQLRQGNQRKAAQELAQQREADQLQAKQLAAQSQASAQASQTTSAAEGQAVSAQVTELTALHSEFTSTMDSLSAKAKSSASASRAWDKAWAKRRAAYTSRSAAVRAHNYSERQRYYGSKKERANSSGKLVVVYTYRPRYWGAPGSPTKPAALKVSVAPEIKRLAALQSQIDVVISAVASQTPAAGSFVSVYQDMAAAAQALGTAVGDASSMARTVVVKRGDKGQVVVASKISKVDQTALDAPFGQLDQSLSAALTAAGLSPAQVTTGGVGVP